MYSFDFSLISKTLQFAIYMFSLCFFNGCFIILGVWSCVVLSQSILLKTHDILFFILCWFGTQKNYPLPLLQHMFIFFSNEQNELPKRRNEADVASQIRLQLRSENFTQEKTEAPCFPTEEITKWSTSRGRSLGKSIPLECSTCLYIDINI